MFTEASYCTYLLVNYCMPTLLHRKPASLVNIFSKYYKDQMQFEKLLKSEVAGFGCDLCILYENDKLAVLLIYDNAMVNNIIHNQENLDFLCSCGYEIEILEHLKLRYKAYKEKSSTAIDADESLNNGYPHEIGLILGFPLQDVKDFIRYEGKDYLYCGAWKVYHDLEQALRIFESYKRIREQALQIIADGSSMEKLKKLI